MPDLSATPAAASDAVASAPNADAALDASFARAEANNAAAGTETTDAPEDAATRFSATPQAEPTPPIPPLAPPLPEEDEEDPDYDQTDDKIEPDHIDVGADGRKRLHFREDKAQALLRARDFREAVLKSVPNATPEQIAKHYEGSLVLQQMETDYNVGDPQRMNAWASHWFGRDANPAAVGAAVNILARELDQVHPQAYTQMRNTVLLRMVDDLYQEGIRRGDDQLFAAAQHMHNAVAPGRYFTKDQFSQGGEDPLAERERSLQERERSFQTQQSNAQQQQRAAWMRTTDTAVGDMIDREIGAALKPALEKYQFEPKHEKFIKQQVYDALNEARNASPAFQREFNLARQQAQGYPSEQTRGSLIALMQQFVKPVIARSRKSAVESVTGMVLGVSSAAHTKHQQTATRAEAHGTASPVERATRRTAIHGAKTGEDALNAWLA